MSPAPRIIACLDVDAGRVVKGVRFRNLRIVGNPVEAAAEYERQGADEIVFLDISASAEGRETLVDLVREAAATLTVPLTVGGGVRSADDVARLLRSGADKVAINTAAVAKPSLLADAAAAYGTQCIVLAIDAKREGLTWRVYTHGGRVRAELDALAWAAEAQRLGAGEFLVTSMDRDGTLDGYDLDLYRSLRHEIRRPIIASGGCGSAEHIADLLGTGIADAALVASILHDGMTTVAEIKETLAGRGIRVRPEA